MTDIPFDIVGFDLDGTLLDTSGDLTAAINHALALAGRATLSVEEVRPMIGGGAKRMLARGLSATGDLDEAELNRLNGALLDYYAANIAVHSRPYPGTLELLDALDAADVRYAVVTNKLESLAVKLLGELGLLDRMACVLGGDTLGPGNAKPSPALIHEMQRRTGCERPIFIGDSTFDTGAARNAGVPSVAVAFGFLDRPADQLGADHVIAHFNELLPLMRRMGTLNACAT